MNSIIEILMAFSISFLTVSCYIYNSYPQYERMDLLSISSNNYYAWIGLPSIEDCISYCLTDSNCISMTTRSESCWLYNTIITNEFTEYAQDSPYYWVSMIKFPENVQVVKDVKLNLESKYLTTYSLTDCYKKCLENTTCYAAGFTVFNQFKYCYFTIRNEYNMTSVVDGFQVIFRPLNSTQVQTLNGTRLLSTYKSIHTYYERLCYEACDNDVNCFGATFVKMYYGIDDNDYSSYYERIKGIMDCFLSDTTAQAYLESRSTTFIKLGNFTQTPVIVESTTTTISITLMTNTTAYFESTTDNFIEDTTKCSTCSSASKLIFKSSILIFWFFILLMVTHIWDHILILA